LIVQLHRTCRIQLYVALAQAQAVVKLALFITTSLLAMRRLFTIKFFNGSIAVYVQFAATHFYFVYLKVNGIKATFYVETPLHTVSQYGWYLN
jgi:hypothetical protein